MNDNVNFTNSFYRILSSLVLIILALSSIYISGIFLIFLLSAIVFIMTYEWVTITEEINTIFLKSTKSLFNVVIFALSLLSIQFSIIFYILTLLINLFTKNTAKYHKLFILLGPIYLCLPIILLYEVRLLNQGLDLILWFLLIVWSTDICSYIFGKYFGGKKLWISLSPNKTWSGFIFGILGGTLTSVVCFYIKDFNFLNSIFFGFLISTFTQFGDLFESWIKRKHLVKDSGKIIPGHGGILDRLDGLMISSIILYIGCKFYV